MDDCFAPNCPQHTSNVVLHLFPAPKCFPSSLLGCTRRHTNTHAQITRKDVRGPFTAIFSSRNISPAPKCVRAVYLFMLTWKSIIHNLPYQPPERRVIRMCARVCVCVKRFSFLHPPSPFPFSSASLRSGKKWKEKQLQPARAVVHLSDWAIGMIFSVRFGGHAFALTQPSVIHFHLPQ